MPNTTTGRRLVTGVAVTVALVLLPGIAAASSWTTPLRSASSGQSRARSLPSPPTGVIASCAAPSTSRTVTVTWTPVPNAGSYTVYQSKTSATTGYTTAATGVTGTAWTSGNLTAATYWFQVSALIGTKWVSAHSAASNQATTHSTNPFCTVP
jgi:hypothetical protein